MEEVQEARRRSGMHMLPVRHRCIEVVRRRREVRSEVRHRMVELRRPLRLEVQRRILQGEHLRMAEARLSR